MKYQYDLNNPPEKTYFLLLYDEYLGWLLHGRFSLEKCKEIGDNTEGYWIVDGKSVEKIIFEEEYN